MSAIRQSITSFIRRRHRGLALVLVGILLLLGVAEAVVASAIRKKIEAAVRKDGGQIEIARVNLLAPLGVRLWHIKLSKPGPDGRVTQSLTADHLDLKLAGLPGQGRPLMISSVDVYRPDVQVVQAPAPPPAPAAAQPPDESRFAPPPPPPQPAAEAKAKVEIQRIAIQDGQISYAREGHPPIELQHINLELRPTSGSSELYRFSVDADSTGDVRVKGAGSFDARNMSLSVSELSVRAQLAAILAHAPPDSMAGARIDGVLDIHATATVPLMQPKESVYEAQVQLQSLKATLPGGRPPIDRADADVSIRGGKGAGVHLSLRHLEALSGQTLFDLDGGEFATTVDGQGWKATDILGRVDVGGGVAALDRARLRGRWRITAHASGPMRFAPGASPLQAIAHEVLAYPRDVSVQPRGFDLPITRINGGPVSFAGGVIRFQNLIGDYGGDAVVVEDAKLALDDPLAGATLADVKKQIRIEGISGSVAFHQPGPNYPGAVGSVVRQLRPTGTFVVGGGSWYAINRWLPGAAHRPRADFFIRLSTAGGAFALTPHKAPLTEITGDATISPLMVRIESLRGSVFGGTVMGSARIVPVSPTHYDAAATFYNANLQRVWQELNIDLKKPVTGVAYLKAYATGAAGGGTEAALKSLKADGELQVVDGNFGNIATVRAAATPVAKPEQALEGLAAGVFSIADQKVTVVNGAVGNPMFGLQGSGIIGFDKSLDLNVVGAPLGDWGLALKRSNVPIVGDVAGDLAGAIQRVFNGAQGMLLYNIHVQGTTTRPQIQVTPAPILTAPLAATFGQLINPPRGTQLLDRVRSAKDAAEDLAKAAGVQFGQKR